jgi:excisionase family DNA binding protein
MRHRRDIYIETKDMDKPDDADLLYGVAPIAAHLNLNAAQVYHLVAEGRLPSFKIGGRVCARRSSIAAWLAKMEASQEEILRSGPRQ